MGLSELPPLLRELKGAPLALLIALRWVGQPVAQNWLQDATGYKRDTTREGMRLLKRLGLANYDGDDYCTNCQLTGAAAQLPLGYDVLDSPADPDSARTSQVDPAPLQAGVPLDPAAPDSTAIKSQLEGNALIVLKDIESPLSINNNKNAASAKKSQLRQQRGQAAHLKELVEALAARKLQPAAGDNPLPVDLRLCAERLASLGVSASRAELAVALCEWPAAQIMAEISAWAAHCQSPVTGKNLDGRWPYLVASRIQTSTACPATAVVIDHNDLSRYDGYLQYQNDDQPEATD